MQQEKAERITITLPPEMLASIKQKVSAGSYGSTSELIREAMRLWQKKEEEHTARLSLIKSRLQQSMQSGEPVAFDTVFEDLEKIHQRRLREQENSR